MTQPTTPPIEITAEMKQLRIKNFNASGECPDRPDRKTGVDFKTIYKEAILLWIKDQETRLKIPTLKMEKPPMSSYGKYCVACNQICKGKYCDQCGKIPTDVTFFQKCRGCFTNTSMKAKFCELCGAPFDAPTYILHTEKPEKDQKTLGEFL